METVQPQVTASATAQPSGGGKAKALKVVGRLHYSAMVLTGVLAAGTIGFLTLTYERDQGVLHRARNCAQTMAKAGARDAEIESGCNVWLAGSEREIRPLDSWGPDRTGDRALVGALSALPFLLVWGLGSWVRYLFRD